MPEKAPSIERLDLRFRVPEAPPATMGVRAWGAAVAIGLIFGVCMWFAGQHVLRTEYEKQLNEADNTASALLALEQFHQLAPEDQHGIYQRLAEENLAIARVAYRLVEERIDDHHAQADWVQLESIAQQLDQLPTQLPRENSLLISGLAAKLYGMCLEEDPQRFETTLATCQTLVMRASDLSDASALSDASLDAVAADIENTEVPEFQPPPPLARNTAAAALNAQTTDAASQFTYSMNDDPTQQTDPQQPDLQRPGVAAANASPVSLPYASQMGVNEPLMTGDSAAVRLVTKEPLVGNAANDASQRETAFRLSDEMGPVEPPVTVAQSTGYNQPDALRVSETEVLGGLDQRTDDELVRLLASVRPRVVQSAALHLKSRGWPDNHLQLASELATCSESRRLTLLGQVATRSDINPRRWLLWMAEEGEPQVRKTAVNLLQSMLTPSVEISLRDLLAREQDENVGQAIRTVLLTGSQASLR